MMIRAVAWDIDGTLIDSEPLHEAVLLEVSSHYGVDLSDLPENQFRGVQMPDVWKVLEKRFPASLEEEEWQNAIVERYVERAEELRPLPGALETMRIFTDAGLKQVCVSNSSRHIVDANLHALDIRELIEFSISRDDVVSGKPDPEPYLAAARRLGIPVGSIAAIEDSITGATSAHLAGLPVFGIALDYEESVGPASAVVRRLLDLPLLILPPS